MIVKGKKAMKKKMKKKIKKKIETGGTVVQLSSAYMPAVHSRINHGVNTAAAL